ncbi:UDP binding domain-containing protein [Streptomyces sp. NPDC005408]|uniref:protein kinase domain-containing protein n=1 Tax=Streptomyces sp. NPDC005408 TaxID=3155341 RepID=UPI0033AD0C9C
MTLLKDDPTLVGSYRLESRLGSGGMGVVYRAYSEAGDAVALKVIRRQWAEDPEFRARFELEVVAARMVHSAFTAPIIDADPHATDPWMASPYIPGESLTARVREHGPLEGQELCALAKALAGALRDIHRAGVVHRDLKPGNVLLSERGPLIIDFGVSRAIDGNPLTAAGQIVGTPAYMAPEQITTPSDAGPAADVFSLGCVLVFAATGHGPFEADSPYAAAYRSMHEEPDLSTLSDPLRSLVAVCLSKSPAERPTPQKVLASLAAPEQQQPTRRTAARTLRAIAAGWLTRRMPAWLAVLAALVSATAAVAAVAAVPPAPATTPRAGKQAATYPGNANCNIRRCFKRETDPANRRNRMELWVELAEQHLVDDEAQYPPHADLKGKRITIWGATTGPNTDDIRDSPALAVAQKLHELGAQVTVSDPKALDNARKLYPELDYIEDPIAAVQHADLLLHLTDWPQFNHIDPHRLATRDTHLMTVIDGTGTLNRDTWLEAGWIYHAPGNGPIYPWTPTEERH